MKLPATGAIALQRPLELSTLAASGCYSTAGFYSGCDDDDEKDGEAAPARGGKIGSPNKSCPDGKLFSMTVTEMSNWLTSNGHQAEVSVVLSQWC